MSTYREKLNSFIKYKYKLMNYVDSHMIQVFLPLLIIYSIINIFVSILAASGANYAYESTDLFTSNPLIKIAVEISLNAISILPFIIICVIVYIYVISPQYKQKFYDIVHKYSFKIAPPIIFIGMNSTVCILAIVGADHLSKTSTFFNQPYSLDICFILIQIISYISFIIAGLFVINIFFSILNDTHYRE